MKKTVLITGVTGAIGKATALELAKNNCRVILLGRNVEKLAQIKSEIVRATNNQDIETIVADLSEPNSIRQAVSEIKSKHHSLSALVNVAAIYTKDRKENSQGIEYTIATNHIGPFILTNELLDLLEKGKPARVVTVSAPTVIKINFDDINGKKKYSSGFMGAFGASKMMNIMFTYALARRLEGKGITTSVFHPGLVKSELTRNMGSIPYHFFKAISSKPEKAAKMLCALAIEKKYENSNGTFFKANGKEMKSNKYSYDQTLQEKLWTVSEHLSK